MRALIEGPEIQSLAPLSTGYYLLVQILVKGNHKFPDDLFPHPEHIDELFFLKDFAVHTNVSVIFFNYDGYTGRSISSEGMRPSLCSYKSCFSVYAVDRKLDIIDGFDGCFPDFIKSSILQKCRLRIDSLIEAGDTRQNQ
jgi:hypothetical protein